MILAIETATEVCSVALLYDKRQIDERRTEQYGHHSEKLFTFIEDLQREWSFNIEELEAVLISEGPGSYTGLRIGASGVKGLLFDRNVPLYAINTLAAMSWSIYSEIPSSTRIHATIDARRKHLYHQVFKTENDIINPRSKADIRILDEIEELILPEDTIVGTGWDRLEKKVQDDTFLYGVNKITAKSLIGMYNASSMHKTNQIDNVGEMKLIRQVEPGQFDPRYITKKQAGT